jgi:hypothetical protein
MSPDTPRLISPVALWLAWRDGFVAIAAVYRPRNPEENPIYGIVAGHLETFLARQRERDRHVPVFVEKCGAPHFSTNVKSSVMWS